MRDLAPRVVFGVVTTLAVACVLGVHRGARADAGDRITDRLKQVYYDLVGVQRIVYVDDQGREVMADRIASVPERYRDTIRALDADDEVRARSVVALDFLALGDARKDQIIYGYMDATGHTVYTNIVETVPPDAREKSVIDLSKVSLNTELGAALEQSLMAEHRRLLGAPDCGPGAAATAGASFWRKVWADYAPLIVCVGVLLAMFTLTPFMLRRVAAPAWARALSFSVPLVAIVGMLAFMVQRTSHTLTELRARVRPCQPVTWSELAKPGERYSLGGYAASLQRLRMELDAIGEQREAGTRKKGESR